MISFSFKKRLKHAAWLALPCVILGTGFTWQAWQDLSALKRLLKDPTPITWELVTMRMQDQWQQELRQFIPVPPESERQLPVMDLDLSEKQMPLLMQKGKHPFVPVEVGFDNLTFKGEVRLRGYKPWHIAETKKSLRLKLKKGDFFLGHRQWNLNNPDRPVLFEEKWVFELAETFGLMTPASDFLRLRLNGLDMGVYAAVAPLDENVLRLHQRFPGDLYRLENRDLGWQNSKNWQYESWYDSEQKHFQNLSRLLDRIQRDSDLVFAEYAQAHLNLRAFAVLDILSRVFAEKTADPELNYALYFDPYRGQWEPVLFEFTGLGLGEAPAPDPLFVRLDKLPAYRHLRTELYRTLITQELQPAQLQAKGHALIQRLRPDLAADPYWRARGLYFEPDRFRKELMRPMSLKQLQAAFQLRLQAIAQRRLDLDRLWLVQTPQLAQETKPLQK